MAALEDGHAAAASGAASPKAAAPVDRYHLAYIIFYLQVRPPHTCMYINTHV